MLKVIIAILSLLSSDPLISAPSWHRIGGDDDMIFYVDANSIITEGSTKVALTLTARSQPTASGAYFVAVTVAYDCKGKRYRDLDFAFIDAEGTVIRTEPSRAGPDFKVPAANSFNEMMLHFVCSRSGGVRVDNPLEDSEGYFTH